MAVERQLTRSARPSGLRARGAWHRAAFWDEVEAEVEAPDPVGFAEFLLADSLPIEPGPLFEAELFRRLTELFAR
jgi:hypothetical protein